MQPFTLLDTATEHGSTLRLYQRGEDFSIRVDKAGELMNSRQHYSEEALARFACEYITDTKQPRMLIGGLGLGYTLAEALKLAPADAHIVVAELMACVVRWNHKYLGTLASFPLQDPRVEVAVQDVGKVMREQAGSFDAIMLDVDNGPDGFTRDHNDTLYGLNGLTDAYEALRPNGILTVWSAFQDEGFTQRMIKIGFKVKQHQVRSQSAARGQRHYIWSGIRLP